jgi:hypothetical protein
MPKIMYTADRLTLQGGLFKPGLRVPAFAPQATGYGGQTGFPVQRSRLLGHNKPQFIVACFWTAATNAQLEKQQVPLDSL